MIKPTQAFLTMTLSQELWGPKVIRILAASIAAVDPAMALARALKRNGDILEVAGQKFDLADFSNLHLLAIGKAGIPMAAATADLISDHLSSGAVLTKSVEVGLPDRYQERIKVYLGNHPIPEEKSLNSTEEILSQFSHRSENDLVIVLISGGGSALFSAPVPGVTINDFKQANRVFLDHGLDIQEINTIRKHISLTKGGQLARVLHPARMITLILSDVIGDPIDVIASGPTVPDPSTYQDALAILSKYNLDAHLPEAIIEHLQKGVEGKIPETPKPGDPIFQDQSNLVIAGIEDAIQGAFDQAQKDGFSSEILPEFLEDEARSEGKKLAENLRQSSLSDPQVPLCLIAGGESTVTLTDTSKPGKGGRNLELALAAVRVLAGNKDLALVTLATDGEDGVTDAAGAIVTGDTLARAEALGLDPDDFLSKHDSYSFFQPLDDLLKPGVTGTNVNDLCFLFSFK